MNIAHSEEQPIEHFIVKPKARNLRDRLDKLRMLTQKYPSSEHYQSWINTIKRLEAIK